MSAYGTSVLTTCEIVKPATSRSPGRISSQRFSDPSCIFTLEDPRKQGPALTDCIEAMRVVEGGGGGAYPMATEAARWCA